MKRIHIYSPELSHMRHIVQARSRRVFINEAAKEVNMIFLVPAKRDERTQRVNGNADHKILYMSDYTN